MENLSVNFVATADFKQAYVETAKFNAALGQMQKNLATMPAWAAGPAITKMRQALNATGQFGVSQFKNVSATQQFTKALDKQGMSIRQLIGQRKLMNQVLKEQYQLQRAMAAIHTTNGIGQMSGDLIIPRDAPKRLGNFKQSLVDIRSGAATVGQVFDETRLKVGLFSQAMRSSAAHMQQWGRTTQYAGMQAAYGITAPFAAFGAVAGAAAYEVDKQLTRVTKVYDYTTDNIEKEQAQLRADAKATARTAAQSYGQMADDTLEIQQALAAVGVTGNDLQQKTLLVSRAMMLGELDRQDAIKGTIALQTVYKLNTEQLGDAFNYMNSMENATSLSMQDFIEALPRGAGVLRELGVELTDLGPLLAALKNQGVEAATGMNGLRSSALRLLKPTKDALDFFKNATGESLQSMIDLNKGNFVGILEDMGTAMANLEPYQRQQIIARVFGVYQADKMNGVMNALIDRTGEIGRAFDVAKQSSAQWGETANREMSMMQESISGKFRRALATLKVELADAGEPFLELATTVVSALSDILGFINGLSEGQKKFLLFAGAAAALIAPIIMIAGAFANLFGQVLKGMGTIGTLITRFKLLNPEAKTQELLAKQTAMSWYDEANAARVLSAQMRTLTNEMSRLAAMSAGAQSMGIKSFNVGERNYGTAPAPELKKDDTGKYRRPGGQFASSGEIAAFEAQQRAAAATKEMSDAAGKAEPKWRAMAGHASGIAATGAVILGMTAGSSEIANNLSIALMTASLIGPTLGRGIGAAMGKLKTAGGTGGALGKMSKGVEAVSSKAKGLGTNIAQAVARNGKAFGIIGIAASAAAVGIMYLNNKIKQTADAAKDVAESGKTMAEVLGFEVKTPAEQAEAAGKAVDDLDEKVKKFTESNKAAAKELAGFMNQPLQQKWGRAVEEGMKTYMQTGSKEAAEKASRLALSIMGERMSEADFKVRLNLRNIDFADSSSMITGQMHRIISDALSATEQGAPKGFWESIFNSGELSQAAGESVRAAAKQALDLINSAPEGQKVTIFDSMMHAMTVDLKKSLSRYKNELKSVGIDSLDELMKLDTGEIMNRLKDANIDPEVASEISRQADAARAFLDVIAESRGVDKNSSLADVKKAFDFGPAVDKSAEGVKNVTDAQNAYKRELSAVALAGGSLNEQERLAILNKYRLAAGLAAAKSTSEGFTGEIKKAAEATKDLGKAAEQTGYGAIPTLEEALGSIDSEEYAQTVTDSLQSIYSNTMDDAFGRANEIMEEQQQAVIDGIERRGEQRIDALEQQTKQFEKRWDSALKQFDKRWDDRKENERDLYEKRIEGIEAAIDAEKNAEEQRQKLFEAEKMRIERLANLFNRNVDFNVALNTGNLDEAARIANDMQSEQASWNQDEASSASASATDARVKQLEGSIERLQSERDARMKMLDELEERERASLERQKEMERERLDAAKDRVNKQTQAEVAAANKRFEANKRALELELATLRAFIPRNEAEMRAHMSRIQAAYAKYGINLKQSGNEWSKFVGTALYQRTAQAANDIRSKISWQNVANHIASTMSKSALGMNLSQFQQWVKTGQMPATPAPAAGRPSTGASGPGTSKPYGEGPISITRHKGGPVGGGPLDSRAGYPAGAARFPSEVDLRAKVGEYVVNDKAVKKYGLGFMNAVNSGKLGQPMDYAYGKGGVGGGPLPFAAAFSGALMTGMMRMGMNEGFTKSAAQQQASYMGVPGMAGEYGGVKLSQAQLNNAAKIIAVGKSMGASSRDLQIAIMTAMQESMLKNYANKNVPSSMKIPHEAVGSDHDSVGLFQQRPNPPEGRGSWGTVAQIMNPEYAARKFFEKLLRNKDRNSMTMGQAAQKVQVSAFPGAYDKWAGAAAAIVNGTGVIPAEAGAAYIGGGAWQKPMRPGTYRVSSEYGPRGGGMHYGIDLAAPTGTPFYASAAGRIERAGDFNNGYGNYIVLNHGAMSTGYAHASRLAVRAGQTVNQGQLIGYVGSTGQSTGPHLHFMMGRPNAWTNNPRGFIPGLATGGLTMGDGYAYLHKNEAVLTAPLTKDLKEGIQNIDSSSNATYNVTINAGNVDRSIDLERAIERGISKAEAARQSRQGVRRTVK